jgi:hypothetical protein
MKKILFIALILFSLKLSAQNTPSIPTYTTLPTYDVGYPHLGILNGNLYMQGRGATWYQIATGLPNVARIDTPSVSSYKTLLQGMGSHKSGKVSGTYMLGDGDSLIVSGSGVLRPIELIYIAASDFPSINGKTPKLRVRAIVSVNGTAPTGNFTVGLYPVTSGAGGAGLKIYTVGSLVSGSATTTVTTPAASSMTTVTGSDFALPTDGVYCLAVVTTATVATSSLVHVNSFLQMRNN